ncbi:MAG: hypothetical protein JWM27_2330, partial [Gemmatimonadetes bacterium]|nr:hypothetical protein [Gemmatimonadota bacterium]
MSDASPNEVVRASANRLYWNSADTVDDIAGRLGIGRSALYGAIRPAPAGADCARCGAAMVFANRSARAAGRARCPECGSTATLGAESHPLERPSEPAPVPRPAGKSAADGPR